MTESEARAVARWDIGSCLIMVRGTRVAVHLLYSFVLASFTMKNVCQFAGESALSRRPAERRCFRCAERN